MLFKFVKSTITFNYFFIDFTYPSVRINFLKDLQSSIHVV